MSKVEMVRALVNQRLTAAVEEIFGLFERTIAEYEEELCRSKEKNERQQKLLDAVLKPEVRLHRADIQQLVVKEEVPPEQQEWSPSLDQEDPPEPPHIKEEQEELWTSQEGEQLQGLEEADITKFLFTPDPVKSEDDEEKPQSSQLHQRQTEQMETGADGEDCGGPEPARNSHPDPHLQPQTGDSEDWNDTTEHLSSVNLSKKPFSCSKCGKRFSRRLILKRHMRTHTGENHKCVGPRSSQLRQQDKTEDSSDTADSDEWSKDIREPPSGSKSLNNNEVSTSGVRCNAEENPHMAVHTGEKRFSCSVCYKAFTWKRNLTQHMTVHTREKRFSCSLCERRFRWKAHLTLHNMDVHKGNKPFKCSVCEKSFTQKSNLTTHMAVHTGQKLFSCSVCEKGFKWKGAMKVHMAVHKGDKPFKCSVCGKSFTLKGTLTKHMAVHTGERRFSCSVCEKRYTLKRTLTDHMAVHTGQKRFCCSVCDQRFTVRYQLTKHKRVCPQSSQLHQTEQNREAEPGASSSTEQMEPGADGEDCGGPEPARNSHPDPHLQPETEDSDDWNDTTEHESSVNLTMKPFSCSQCGSTQAENHKCIGPQSSQLHQQDKTEDSSDTEDSDEWSKDIREPPSGLESLKNNEDSESGVRCNAEENPLSCSLCGKAFTRKNYLRQHMAVHTGQKLFSCSVCKKRFKRKGDMKVHMAVHTGETPFQCSVCSKRFTQKAGLRLHMPLHTGDKPFKCSVCEKAFTQKSNLTKHMDIHTGEKRFICSVCSKRFTQNTHLTQHKRVCPQSSQLHQTEQNREAEPGASSSTEQMETGADGEDCGGPEPARNSHPDF